MEIVMTVCALLATAKCEEQRISLDPEAQVTPVGCMMQSMPLIAQWADQHPKWVVKRWKCESRERRSWPV